MRFPAFGCFATVMVCGLIWLSAKAQGVPIYSNLAKYQQAIGSTTGYSFSAQDFCTDGIASNFHRWRSTNASGQTLEITYPRAVTIASAHLYNGVKGATNTELWRDFKFQYDNGGIWVDIPGGSRSSNTDTEVSIIFTQAVTSHKFRLVNTESGSAVRSVRELAMFEPNLVGGIEQGYPIGTDVICNLSHRQPATASTIDGTNYAINAVDGFVDDSSRWLCNTGIAGEWLEIDLLGGNQWGEVYEAIGSAHVYSGDFASNTNALSAFTLEYWDTVNNIWAAIPGATITANTQNIRTITFSSHVVTNKVRLVNNTTTAAKIAELQIFPPRSGGYPTGHHIRTEAPPTSKLSDFSDSTHHLGVSSTGLKLGTAVLENGKIRYTPVNGFSGTVQFSYTITDGTVTDTAEVTITVRPNQAPNVDAGPDQTVLLDEVTAIAPVSGAYFEWDSANDVAGDDTWTSTTANIFTWTFGSGNQTPVDVTDSRFARISKAYAFPAARDVSNSSFDNYGSGQKATFEFVLDIDGANGSIFETGGGGSGLQVDVVDGVLRGSVSQTSPAAPARASYTLTPTDLDRFIHVVFVADNVADVIQLYIDGQMKDEQPWTLSDDWSGTNGGALGGFNNSSPEGGSRADFIGELALFRFYRNKAFTAGEVSTNLSSLIGGRARTVSLDGTVTDADGDAVTTTWELVSGPDTVVFGNTAAVDTTATFTAVGTYVLRLTASDGITNTSDELTIIVGTPYQNWAIRSFNGLFTDTDYTSDPDGDLFSNLQEFAFGMDPTSPATSRLTFVEGGDVTQPGGPKLMDFAAHGQAPDYRAVFIRRKDHAAAGFVYTVHFSADLNQWTPSNVPPTVLTDVNSTSEHEVVSIPFPDSVSVDDAGPPRPARFMRVSVSME